MDNHSTSLAAPGGAPGAPRECASRKGASNVPCWTLLRRIHLRKHDDTSEAEPNLVGVRDRESGQTRIFMVYHSAPGAAHDTEPPPDPDPPPATPAQARPRIEPGIASEDNSGDWPCARAA